MHKKNLYQTHLTEGQWSYINKEWISGRNDWFRCHKNPNQ